MLDPNWSSIVDDLIEGQHLLDQKKADIDTALRLLRSAVTTDEIKRNPIDASVAYGQVTWHVYTAYQSKSGGLWEVPVLSIECSVYDVRVELSPPPIEHVWSVHDALGTLFELLSGRFSIMSKLTPYFLAAAKARIEKSIPLKQ